MVKPLNMKIVQMAYRAKTSLKLTLQGFKHSPSSKGLELT